MQMILLAETASTKSVIVYNDTKLGLAEKRSRLSEQNGELNTGVKKTQH